VDAVEDGVVVRELGGEAAQRRDLVRSRAGGFQRFPAIREGAGDVEVPVRVGVRGRLAQTGGCRIDGDDWRPPRPFAQWHLARDVAKLEGSEMDRRG